MAITQTGSTTTIDDSSAESDTQAIEVPGDADFCVVAVGFYDPNGTVLSRLNWDGDAGVNDFVLGHAENTANSQFTLLYHFVAPPTGSQTLYWTFSNGAVTEGAIIFVSFYVGVDQGTPVEDDGGALSTTASSLNTGALSADSGDAVVAVFSSFRGIDVAISWTNATEVDESFFNTANTAYAHDVSLSGGVTVTAETVAGGNWCSISGMTLNAAAAGVEVSAGVDALTLTELDAGVNAAISFTAGLDALTLTEFAATVNAEISFTAGLDALTLAELNATVNAAVSFTAGLDALTLAEFGATVNAEISFTAGLDALILTEYAANVDDGLILPRIKRGLLLGVY